MITVAEETKRLVQATPFLEEAMHRGIINHSALAREMQPQIEAVLRKSVSHASILMALKRLSARLGDERSQADRLLKQMGEELMVRSNLSELTYKRSETIIANQKRLLDQIQGGGDLFMTFAQGVFEATIIVSSRLCATVEAVFSDEKQISHQDELSAIVIRLPFEAVSTPGVHHRILQQLAWKNINIIQLVSTLTELTVILAKREVDLAFSVLLGFFSE